MATILVVDDDADIRSVLRRLMERAGHRVIEADSAAAAMAAVIGSEPPDAVVSDVVMPQRSGLDFYADLVAQAPHLRQRVIFLTGAAGERGVHDRIEQLGVPLLAKLGDMQLVVDAVRFALLRPAAR
jgi:DNA-binding NtrC family response regulator